MRWLIRTAILAPVHTVSLIARTVCAVSSLIGGYTVYGTARIEMWAEEEFPDEPVTRNPNDRK